MENVNETIENEEISNNETAIQEQRDITTPADNSVFKNAGIPTMWNDVKLMQNAWKMATVISKTSIVPDAYKDNAGSCLIAIDIANRMGLSPIMVMQNSQTVKGNFTWKGSACKGLIDNCGRFKQTEYVFIGEKNTSNWGCYMKAFDTETGKMVTGTTVDMQMAKDEGWLDKSGSKWKTMPELMLQYRAATFFARTNCPQVLMGFNTTEELIDIGKGEEEIKEKIKITLD